MINDLGYFFETIFSQRNSWLGFFGIVGIKFDLVRIFGIRFDFVWVLRISQNLVWILGIRFDFVWIVGIRFDFVWIVRIRFDFVWILGISPGLVWISPFLKHKICNDSRLPIYLCYCCYEERTHRKRAKSKSGITFKYLMIINQRSSWKLMQLLLAFALNTSIQASFHHCLLPFSNRQTKHNRFRSVPFGLHFCEGFMPRFFVKVFAKVFVKVWREFSDKRYFCHKRYYFFFFWLPADHRE